MVRQLRRCLVAVQESLHEECGRGVADLAADERWSCGGNELQLHLLSCGYDQESNADGGCHQDHGRQKDVCRRWSSIVEGAWTQRTVSRMRYHCWQSST